MSADRELRDAIANAIDFGGPTAEHKAEAILAMPEMQAIRAIVQQMGAELAVWRNDRAYTEYGLTTADEEITRVAANAGAPPHVVAWLGEVAA